jgi:aldehyde:ferredoxin oxidoreductase
MIPTAVNEIITAVTGLSEDEVKQSGSRALQVRHLFNIREGLRRKDFTISDRAIGKGDGLMTKGPTANRVIDNETIADIFFEKAGWDKETGIPDLDVLKSLDMEDAVSRVPVIVAGV